MKLEMIMMMTVAFGEILFVLSQECPPFGKMKFRKVKYRSNLQIARFRCRRKSQLLGAKLLICLSGKWNHPAPVCIAPGCEIPDSTANLIMTTSRRDALLTLECQPGYTLQGPKTIYCDKVKWSAPISTCKYNEPDLLCTFESTDLCGWNQRDHSDWTVRSGGTPTSRTGPDNDHTFGSVGGGHYLYMESSPPRKEGHTATISSRFYRHLQNGTCFEFYYHMKGLPGPNEVGRLLVYVRRAEEDIEEILPSFNESGHQSDHWLRGSFEIRDVTSPIQIVVIGIRGKSALGDIAFDDARMYNCSDDVDDVTTESEQLTTMQPTTEFRDLSTKTSGEFTTDSLLNVSMMNGISSEEITTHASGSFTVNLSTAPPQVVEVTTESVPTEETTMEIATIVVTTATETTLPSKTPTTTTTRKPTMKPTTKRPTTIKPTTKPPTTMKPTTKPPTTMKPTTKRPTTPKSTIKPSTTPKPTTKPRTTPKPTTKPPTTIKPTTKRPTTIEPTTKRPTTMKPTTKRPTTEPTSKPTTTKRWTVTTKKETLKPTSMQTTSTTLMSTTTKTALKTSSEAPKAEVTKQASISTTTNTAQKSTTTVSDNSIPEVTRTPQNNNETDIPNVIQVGKRTSQSKGPVKPLMIGVGVGVAIGLAIVLVIVFLYMKKQRKKHDDMEDEMAPIARNAYSEW
ncbi:anti-sigma-I factor RsgI2-like [Ylistrum balloti]|uniref:anti-sigma-I factor RsgI2-like n=1 Tax=Ylistrum balloti TaxID=509963 RepID=UPI002905878E|nr:anti-sigma-I factor RsgI2-like [Ylistrum balloti]